MALLKDVIWVPGTQSVSANYWELENASVTTGIGRKTITAVGGYITGINLSSTCEPTILITSDDKDTISGTGYKTGISLSYATLSTARGDDSIIGNGGNNGINLSDSEIDTGDGEDRVIGNGYNYGIYNSIALIKTGNGNDNVTGGATYFDGAGIYNNGAIDTRSDQIVETIRKTNRVVGNKTERHALRDKDLVMGTSTEGKGIENIGYYYYGNVETIVGKVVIEQLPIYQGLITTGEDEDRVIGKSTFDAGIVNAGGVIDAGSSADEVSGEGGMKEDNTHKEAHGILNRDGALIATQNGNDKVIGTSKFRDGIHNENSIVDTGNDDDQITGTSQIGHGILNYSDNDIDYSVVQAPSTTIRAGIYSRDGSDKVIGTSKSGDGIHNENALLDTGLDNDEIRGTSDSGSGILNGSSYRYAADSKSEGPSIPLYGYGEIDTSDGIDSITGTTKTGIGIRNGFLITATPPNQVIPYNGYSNTGLIDTGAQGDRVTGTATGTGGIGISNSSASTIITGDGDDSVVGTATGTGGIGIYNDGTINTGTGKDTVSALRGGFSGSGTVLLDEDDDTLIGFGTGSFNGGNGNDKILLGNGVYTIDATLNTITAGSTVMNVVEFEQVGGSSGGLFGFASGTLTVALGIGTFVPTP